VWSHLHAVDGVSQVVELVRRRQRLQSNVGQFEVLLTQLLLQVGDHQLGRHRSTQHRRSTTAAAAAASVSRNTGRLNMSTINVNE